MPSTRALGTTTVALVAVLAAAGCGSDEQRACRRSGGAEVCLAEEGSGYGLEGSGFRPSSEATVTTGDGGEPLVVPVDGSGRLPGDSGGMLGVLGGGAPQRVVITGTTSAGAPARFEFTVPL